MSDTGHYNTRSCEGSVWDRRFGVNIVIIFHPLIASLFISSFPLVGNPPFKKNGYLDERQNDNIPIITD